MRAAAIAAFAGLALSACDGTTQSAIGEAIEMGPYTFSVISATQGKQWESAEGTYREIVVRLRVHRDDTAPFTENFSSSFIDSMSIVDSAGNSVRTGPAPVSPVYTGGRYRSEYYQCVFRYSRSSEGVRDFARIGTRPQDFRLLIANPAREGEQPRRVAIQLG
jgi:hypothetical protein